MTLISLITMPTRKSKISSLPVSLKTQQAVKKLKQGGESYDELIKRKLLKPKKR